jgi:phosphoribosylglycinamide formyltransferase 2
MTGVSEAMTDASVDVRVFGKPSTRPYRRMAVALAFDTDPSTVDEVRTRAARAASSIVVHPRSMERTS